MKQFWKQIFVKLFYIGPNKLTTDTRISISRIKFNTSSFDQEQLERKKAEYAEKMRNKIALVHREAEEKRATVEAKRGEETLKAEELAAKFRATGTTPKKAFGCF